MSIHRSDSESRLSQNQPASRPCIAPPAQTSHDPLHQALREVLVDGVRAGRSASGGIGSVPFRACAVLYALLLDHSVDPWGRCRSCRRPGSVFGRRWRPCQVYGTATWRLRQLDEVLLRSVVTRELGLADPPPSAAPGPARAGDS